MMKIISIATLLFSMVFGWGQQAIAAEDMADMPGMDHGSMGHKSAPAAQQEDMSQMEHGQMEHGQMGHDAPAGARDPHAYSDGYDFGHMPPHKMADEAYWRGLMVDRLEGAQSHGNSFNAYELQGWFGKDYDRLVLKAEGEVESGSLHEARTELLWSHAVAAFWNAQLGARYDSGLTPDRKWLALGMQGLAPYWFEIDATAYIGEQGRTALRFGAEYELLLTQKLILQPRIEADVSGKQDADSELGSGLSNLVAGVRLRYEIYRELAPYIGVEWSGKFAGTADYAQAAGDRTDETRMVAGVRFWF